MDYKKEYVNVLMRAEEAVQKGCLDRNTFDAIFSELTESEDERIRRTLAKYFGPEAQLDFVRGIPIQKIRDWLEKQKEQKPSISCGHENDTEWSEEDEKMLKNVLFVLESYVSNSECASSPSLITSYPTYYKEIDWLKSLPLNLKKKNEDVAKLCSNEWSEEDENALKYLHELISWSYTEKFMDAQTAHDMRLWINEHLKSLRPSWKPSEEQMGALNYAYCELLKRGYVGRNILGSLQKLIDQLRKQM